MRSTHKDIRQPELEGEDSFPSGSVMTLHRAMSLPPFQKNACHGICTLPSSHGRRQDELGAGGCGVGGGKGNRKFAYERSL